MNQFVVALIRSYQIFLSPIFPSSCRFTPSCSEYAITAVQKYGAVKGLYLILRRLIRCRPLGPKGFDPVP